MNTLLKNVKTILDELDVLAIEQRAVKCWKLMTKAERASLRFGLSPFWTLMEDLGGKVEASEIQEDIRKDGERGRLLVLALIAIAKRTGGMVA